MEYELRCGSTGYLKVKIKCPRLIEELYSIKGQFEKLHVSTIYRFSEDRVIDFSSFGSRVEVYVWNTDYIKRIK